LILTGVLNVLGYLILFKLAQLLILYKLSFDC